MAITTPTPGQHDWDTTLNKALTDLDETVTEHDLGDDPHGDRAYADANFQTTAVQTVTEFISSTPFAIAHRGSGMEFPEHTLAAYRTAVAAGAKAIEVSVRLSADGVPVCFHDTTMSRTTDGGAEDIETLTYAEIQEALNVTPQELLGAGWSSQKAPTMREVLDEFLGRVVVFLEPKSNRAVPVVQQQLTDFYPNANQSVVWKHYYTSNSFPWAKSSGYVTWGYMDTDTTSGELDAVDGNVDMWGVPDGSSDAQVEMVVARGKPVIVWEVTRHADVARFVDLGVSGLMETNWLYLNNAPALTADRFDLQASPPGTLGIANYNEDYALKYDGTGRAYINVLPNTGVLMGAHRAPNTDDHIVGFTMTWDDLGSNTSLHSDVAFCRSLDDPYQFSGTNNTHGGYGSPGGYHAVLRRDGDIQIYRHDQGVTSGTQLDTVSVDPGDVPATGTSMDFEITVTPTSVSVTRTDTATPYTATATDATYRGRYWHLCVGSVVNDAEKPYFSSIAVA